MGCSCSRCSDSGCGWWVFDVLLFLSFVNRMSKRGQKQKTVPQKGDSKISISVSKVLIINLYNGLFVTGKISLGLRSEISK